MAKPHDQPMTIALGAKTQFQYWLMEARHFVK